MSIFIYSESGFDNQDNGENESANINPSPPELKKVSSGIVSSNNSSRCSTVISPREGAVSSPIIESVFKTIDRQLFASPAPPSCVTDNESSENNTISSAASLTDEIQDTDTIDSDTESQERLSSHLDQGADDIDEKVALEAMANPTSAEAEETEQQRIDREIRESEAYVWELMRAEAQEAYEAQMSYMREHAHLMSAEDLAALQQAVAESVDPALLADEENQRDQSVDSAEEDGAWADPNNYDQLLALGAQLGDVKKDQWRAVAPRVIAALPCATFSAISAGWAAAAIVTPECSQESTSGHSSTSTPSSSRSSPSVSLTYSDKRAKCAISRFHDVRCAVCMEPFDPQAKLVLLPCTHYFHCECVAGWVSDNNSCPCCKTTIVSSPQSK